MNESRTIPKDASYDVVQFDILSEGQDVSGAVEVMSVTVTKEFNRLSSAKIVIRDGDAAKADFEASNEAFFLPGKKITIKAGLDNDRTQIFEGLVVKHCIRVREQGNSDLILECRDASIRMTLGRHSKYYKEMKDSEVMEEIVGQYGLQSDVEATSLKHYEIVQHNCTDWDFLLARAEANGKLVLADDGKIQIKKPDSGAASELTLRYGSGEILELETEMDARNQVKNFHARAWDYANQQLFEAESSSSDFSEGGNVSGSDLSDAVGPAKTELQHGGHLLEEELTEWVNGQMLRSRLAKIRGRVKFTGSPKLKPGQMVTLEGMGNRFNGKAFISAVRHEIYTGSWDTYVQLGLPNDTFAKSSDFYEPPAAGLISPIHGLQVGKVVQLQDDPDGEDRILVRLPVIDPNAEGIWSRIASLDAGADRGAFFRPEIDDEVIVGFINDDPRDAIVLGHLHSSANPAPIKASDDNHEKGFTTRSKMHIHFNDDTKTITIDTPAGNSIVIDEKTTSIVLTDQNKNTITMDPNGIELKSPKNITIDAGMEIKIKAGTNLSIGAIKIDIEASGPLTAKGAIAELSSSGITKVAGSLVQIN